MSRLPLALAVALACVACNPTKLKDGYCHTNADCGDGGVTCNNITRKCEAMDASMDRSEVGDASDGGDGRDGGVAEVPFSCMQCMDGGSPVCEVDASRCVECLSNGDCTGGKRICNLSTLTCEFGCSQCASAGDGGSTVCDVDASQCVECLSNGDCSGAKPICNLSTLTCERCTSDSQCIAKVPNPGVCMFHQDGRCATDDETIYVESKTGCMSTPSASGGTMAAPFCKLQDALSAVSSRRLLFIRGSGDVGNTSIQSLAGGQISIIGPGTRITAAAGSPGLRVTASDVFARGIKVLGDAGTDIGIVAESGATIRLDGVTVENMSKGGLRVIASGYEVINSLFAGNGGTIDDGGRFIGGAFLRVPPSGQPARFAFCTIVSNNDKGVVCEATLQTIEASLLANNLGGGTTPDASNCTLSLSKTTADGAPNLTTTDPKYRLTATSPCRNALTSLPANAPDHDIDGTKRPQEGAFDCGADEF